MRQRYIACVRCGPRRRLLRNDDQDKSVAVEEVLPASPISEAAMVVLVLITGSLGMYRLEYESWLAKAHSHRHASGTQLQNWRYGAATTTTGGVYNADSECRLRRRLRNLRNALQAQTFKLRLLPTSTITAQLLLLLLPPQSETHTMSDKCETDQLPPCSPASMESTENCGKPVTWHCT